jgi:hypothetical protein
MFVGEKSDIAFWYKAESSPCGLRRGKERGERGEGRGERGEGRGERGEGRGERGEGRGEGKTEGGQRGERSVTGGSTNKSIVAPNVIMVAPLGVTHRVPLQKITTGQIFRKHNKILAVINRESGKVIQTFQIFFVPDLTKLLRSTRAKKSEPKKKRNRDSVARPTPKKLIKVFFFF